MAHEPRKSFSVGFVLFIATLLAIVGLFMVGGTSFLDRTAKYQIFVPSAQNVRAGTRVYLDGVAVGQVSNVAFQEFRDDVPEIDNVVITIRIAEHNRPRIRGGTVSWLATDGLLGDQIVELTTGDRDRDPIPDGGPLPFVPRNLVDEFVGPEARAYAENLLSELVDLMRSLQDAEGSLGQFLKDEQLYQETTGLVAEARRNLSVSADILEGLDSGERPFVEFMLGPDDAHALSDAIQSAAVFAHRLEEDQGLASSLGPEFVASLASMAEILDKVNRGEGSFGRFINDPTLADNLSNIFLGVREEPMVRNLIRNAEVSGRKIYAEAASRDAAEARIREAIAEQIATEESSAPLPSVPVPSVRVPSAGPGAGSDDGPGSSASDAAEDSTPGGSGAKPAGPTGVGEGQR